MVLSKLNKLDDAIDETKKTIELNGNNAEYHYALSNLYKIELNTASFFRQPSLASSAKEELLTSQKIDPNHKKTIISLADFYLQAPGIMGGDNNKAIEQANRLIKLDEKAVEEANKPDKTAFEFFWTPVCFVLTQLTNIYTKFFTLPNLILRWIYQGLILAPVNIQR